MRERNAGIGRSAEQVLHGADQIATMGLMGLGGLLAVAGGTLFAVVALTAMFVEAPGR